MKILLFTFTIFSNFLFGQYIMGLNLTQNGNDQIKAHLKTYLPYYGEFLSQTTEINQNIITLKVCYWMIDAGVIVYPENDFDIDIPNNGSYTLIVKIYSSSDTTSCNYENLEDSVSLNFTAPINGTISLASEETTNINQLLLFPNPAQDFLNLDTDKKIESVSIYDLSGKIIQNSRFNTKKIDISNLNNGNYFIEIICNKQIIYKKFIIKK